MHFSINMLLRFIMPLNQLPSRSAEFQSIAPTCSFTTISNYVLSSSSIASPRDTTFPARSNSLSPCLRYATPVSFVPVLKVQIRNRIMEFLKQLGRQGIKTKHDQKLGQKSAPRDMHRGKICFGIEGCISH